MSYHLGSVWPHDNALDRQRLPTLRPRRGRAASLRGSVRERLAVPRVPDAGALLPQRADPERGRADPLPRRVHPAGVGGGGAAARAVEPAGPVPRDARAAPPDSTSVPADVAVVARVRDL